MKKKLLFARIPAIFLCLCMCLSLIPAAAFAAGGSSGITAYALQYTYDRYEWADLNDGDILNAGFALLSGARVNGSEELINADSAVYIIDGVEYRPTDITLTGGMLLAELECTELSGLPLCNGSHSITFRVSDVYGNAVTDSAAVVMNNPKSRITALDLSALPGAVPTVGSTYSLYLTVNEYRHLFSLDDVTVRMSSFLPVAEVRFAKGVEGTWTVTDLGNGTSELTLAAPNAQMSRYDSVDCGFGKILAEIVLDVNEAVTPESTFVWSAEGRFSARQHSTGPVADEAAIHSFTMPTSSVEAAAYYTVFVPTLMVGQEAVIFVADPDGMPVPGVNVVCDGELTLGPTDEFGCITTDALTASAARHYLFVRDDEGRCSFRTWVPCFDPAKLPAAPSCIRFNAVTDGRSRKSISWVCTTEGTDAAAMVRYSKDPNLVNPTLKTGESTLYGFSDGLSAVRLNTVTVSGLSADTEYYYQVGDGVTWSPVATFRTSPNGRGNTAAYILGSFPSDPSALKTTLPAALKNTKLTFDFGIQTGNLLNDPNSFSEWSSLSELFSEKVSGTAALLHVTGSRETVNGKPVPVDFGTGKTDGFSASEYGVVYAAAIDYTEDPVKLASALDAMKASASASLCPWKLLVIHEAPYPADTAAPADETFASAVTAACEEAGIGFIFSGSDCTYARTYPLRGGDPAEDGVVCFLTGSLGDKPSGYNGDGRFAFASNTFNAVLLTLEATEQTFKVIAYDVSASGKLTRLDTYTVGNGACASGKHTLTLDPEANILTCGTCGMQYTLKDYCGLVTDGENLYYANYGSYGRGWIRIDGEDYYFSPDTGIAADGERMIMGYNYVFENCRLVDGHWYRTDTGDLALMWAGKRHEGGWFEIGGKTYCFRPNGTAYVKNCVIRTDDSTRYCVFTEDGEYLHEATDGLFISASEIVYLVDGQPVEAGLVRDDQGNLYFINQTLKAVRGYYVVDSTRTNGHVIASFYEFDENYHLIMKEGIVANDWMGNTYYFVDGLPQPMGLVKADDGFYYYFSPKSASHAAVMDTDLNMTSRMTGGKIEPGVYHFDEEGHLILPETEPETTPDEPETQPVEPGTEPDTQPESTPDTQPETDPGTDPETQPETTPGSTTEPETRKPAESEQVTEIETVIEIVTTPSGEIVTTPEGEVVTSVETRAVVVTGSDTTGSSEKGGCKSALPAAALLLLLIPAAWISVKRRH